MSRISFLSSGLFYNILIYIIIIRSRYSASNKFDQHIQRLYVSFYLVKRSFLFLFLSLEAKKREKGIWNFFSCVYSLILILVR